MNDTNITDAIYMYVKDMILHNQLVEHEKISERVLCEKFDTSRTTIRSSIAKLKEDGWVYSKAKSGTYVAPIDQVRMKECYQIRMILEPSVVAYAMYYLKSEDLEQLRYNCSYMQSCSDEEYRELEIMNHKIIENRCMNRTLVGLVENMKDMYERLVAQNSKSMLRRKASLYEWQRILDAIDMKDVELAKQCMSRHVLNGMDEYWKSKEESN